HNYDRMPLKHAYSFDPVPAELSPQYHSKILGLGCQMWSEWIPTDQSMQRQVFPRLAAYAEVGWSEPQRKLYQDFKQILKEHWFPKWKQKKIWFYGAFHTEKLD
ncbi:unnamed protein product, partial [Didymodactylos carnosus]